MTKAEDDKYKSAEAEYTVTIKEYDYSSMNNSLTGTMLQGTQFYVEAPTLSLASDNQAVYVVRKVMNGLKLINISLCHSRVITDRLL